MTSRNITRRSFLAATAAVPLAAATSSGKIPVGLELYSVRNELGKDLPATVAAVAKMGYEVVEFYAPYYQWTEEYAKGVRKQLDDLGMRCHSTHNDPRSFSPEGMQKAIELNQILGTKYIVMASAGNPKTLDDWKRIAETLTVGNEKFRALGLHGGYHNHQTEFRPLEGKRPIEVIAANTPKDFMLQLDVGTCVEVGSDPVAWIEANPGRIRSLHCKDWSRGAEGYQVLFGEGVCPWKQIFAAAERVGGVEYYLIEQEGSRYPELETAQRCLEAYKKLRGI